jgi:hypothetical protein
MDGWYHAFIHYFFCIGAFVIRSMPAPWGGGGGGG